MVFGISLGAYASAANGRDLYWVGGTDSWDGTAGSKWSLTSGGTGGESEPTSIDNVFFDSNSGGGTVTSTSATSKCKNLDFTGFNGTWAGTTWPEVWGSFTMSSGMTRTNTGLISFKSTSPGQTITCNGKTFGNSVQFTGTGGTWQLQDSLSVPAASISVSNGTLDTNNQTVTAGSFSVSGVAARGLILGTSTINTQWSVSSATNLTFSGSSSTINATSNIFGAAGLTYGTVNITLDGAFTLSGGGTFNTLSRTNSSTYSTLLIDTNITVNTSFVATGNNANTQRMGVIHGNVDKNTPITITSNGTNTLTNVDFLAITGTGTASFTGTSVGDCGGNTGITFTSAVTRYLVTSAGSNDFMSNVWATVSGGSVGASRPLPQDTVVIDNNSFSSSGRTLVVAGYRIPTLDFTNSTNDPTLSMTGAPLMLGDIILKAAMTATGSVTTSFMKQGGSQTLTSNTVSIPWLITCTTTGTMYLGSDLTTTNSLAVRAGVFNDNGYNITATAFDAGVNNANRTVTKGSGTYTLTGASTPLNFGNPAGLTYNESGGTIKFTNNGTASKTFAGGSKTFKNFWNATQGTGALIVSGSNTFSEFKTDAARTVSFTGATTQTFGTFTAIGTSGNVITLQSTNTSNYNLVSNSGTAVNMDFVSISRAQCSGATFTATNSTNGGNNSGITITP